MRANPTRRTRHAAGLLAGGLFLAPLAACSDATTDQRVPDAAESEISDALEEAPEVEVPEVDAPEVSCENDTCTVTLATGAEAEILGTTVSFTGSEDGTATVTVGDAEASCAEGESVSAGPLSMECTEVSDESLTLTASLQ